MDFVLRRIENNMLLCDPGSYDYITYLRARIEYCLFLCFGYVWKNFDTIPATKQQEIIGSLTNLSIGSAVSAIRTLDSSSKEIFTTSKTAKIIDKYPTIRNRKMGHGYEMGAAIASSLEPLYKELVESIPLLKENCDLIIVRQYNSSSEVYEGIRYPADTNGLGVRWSCPKELIVPCEQEFPRTYIMYNDKYYKISPFVYINPSSQLPLIFSSLEEKITGKIRMCSLFSDITSSETVYFKELVCLSQSDDGRQFSQSNGTIMNFFTPNYTKYVDVGFHKLIENFLYKNRAYVSGTVWGHGGVGKTACVQKVCYDLFNGSSKEFSYIIFISAKDRVFNTRTGEINSTTGSIRLYSEIIECIANVLFCNKESLNDNPQLLLEYETRIAKFEDKILIVIDDYETFEDVEKEKISNFLSTLNAQYHKAIITTRNKRFVIGEAIPCNELDVTNTKEFIRSVIQTSYSSHIVAMDSVLNDADALSTIHHATSGRPIFIYQFIYIFIQRGYNKKLIDDIRRSSNAEEFLYGRIFNYLSKSAQDIFATISTLTDDDLQFNVTILAHVLSKAIDDNELFEAGLTELSDQRIVELINESYGRVYSQELLAIMSEQYRNYPQDFQSTVKNLLDSIGGKNIKGTIFEAMLEQADKSRLFGNEKETVDLYRRILNHKNTPIRIKKIAIRHIADYLSNARLNSTAAIHVMEEYLPLFEDDSDMHIHYIYLLWSQGKEEKGKATNVIISYFSTPNHKKLDKNNLTFFALGTGYCIDYDLRIREYSNSSLRRARLNKTFNEYGKLLFDAVKTNTIHGKAALFHNIRVALVQTVKLCGVLGKEYKDAEKVNYGLDICKWMRDSKISEPFLSQITKLEDTLGKHLEKFDVSKNDIIEPEIDNTSSENEVDADSVWSNGKQYSVGDVVEVKVTSIKNYGAFASLDQHTSGLIHISEIADRFIADIFSEFTVGEVCNARIVSINPSIKRISLSTMDFR